MMRESGQMLRAMILIALILLGSIAVDAQTRRHTTRPYSRTAQTTRRYTIYANQTIRVRMDQQISSETARIGDRFTTTVVDPVYANNGVEVIPAGSKIIGRVTNVRRAERPSKAGMIEVQFISLRLPNGRTYPINGSLTDLSSTNANYDREGQVTGRSSVKRNAVFIGGGAATGAIIGAAAGGGKGAGIGAGIGAGLGVAGSLLSKGQEAVVKSGTEFGVILNRSISLPAYR
ncbi:MAG: hypothetical protein IRZ19_11440 [Pyrinomonas methylaliphatogenes]|uniref:Uncharacterized protein n=2 Tax=Pyrinomonas methylaliphatogenes TaxID=454194 RepID=A0A0B6WYJ7_9BACT|nr:hypothetical protein [Pyrinomonas methylaliphatogenes]CDM66166.1 hypothetical protein PYK22_02178 [Pyrinomonas methylaliphatogenes]